MVLSEAFKQNDGPLKTFWLKTDDSSVEIQKFLKGMKDRNPNLTGEHHDPEQPDLRVVSSFPRHAELILW